MFVKIQDHMFDVRVITYLKKAESKDQKYFLAVFTNMKDKAGVEKEFWIQYPSAQTRDSDWERVSGDLRHAISPQK